MPKKLSRERYSVSGSIVDCWTEGPYFYERRLCEVETIEKHLELSVYQVNNLILYTPSSCTPLGDRLRYVFE